jgi:electron transfer flavoprotein alpha subunit
MFGYSATVPIAMQILLAGARQLGEHVNAVIWDERDVTEVKQADAVYLLCGKTDKQRVENYAETFASLIRKEDGKTLILLAATRRGKGLAANSACCCNPRW